MQKGYKAHRPPCIARTLEGGGILPGMRIGRDYPVYPAFALGLFGPPPYNPRDGLLESYAPANY